MEDALADVIGLLLSSLDIDAAIFSEVFIATVNDDVTAEGLMVFMTLKKEYNGLNIKTNFVYLHSWGTGDAISTAGSLTLPFALYFAPAGVGLATSVTWSAADLFIFQRFDGSWKKTETETLVLYYPEGNFPPGWKGRYPRGVGGSPNGLD